MWLIFIAAIVGLLWLLGGGASLNLGGGASSDGGSSDTGDSSSSSGSGDSMLRKLAQAIYDFEGSGPNTVATRNNNPGNMKPPDGSSNYWSGQVGVDSRGFAIFDSLDDGFTALMGDLKHKINLHPDWTLEGLFNVWLGSGDPNKAPLAREGNAVNYAKSVAAKLGASINSTLGSLFNA